MSWIGIIRHGVTEWNLAKRIQGHADIPLTQEARQTLYEHNLPMRMEGWSWRCSPLSRAVETATLISGRAAEKDDRLIEMNWGDWEGKTVSELRQELGEAMLANEAQGLDFRPSGGESPREVQNRLMALMAEVCASRRNEIWVTHKGVLRAVMALAYGWDMVGKAPVKFDRYAVHVFDIKTRLIRPVEMNVPLEPLASYGDQRT